MINGNSIGTFQKFKTQKNSISESVREWFDVVSKNGFIDYVTGDTDYEMNAKIQQSTHIFICDWFDCAVLEITSENARLLINNQVYQSQSDRRTRFLSLGYGNYTPKHKTAL